MAESCEARTAPLRREAWLGARFGGRWPIVRFVGLFALFMGLAYAAEVSPALRNSVFPGYLRQNARVCGVMLGAMGQEVTVRDRAISSPRFALQVQHDCNGLLPTALFVSATLASPVAFWTKIPGIIIGAIALTVLNLVRIVAMFYTGVYRPGWFERMHAEVWPAIFICASILLWVLWAIWAREKSFAKA